MRAKTLVIVEERPFRYLVYFGPGKMFRFHRNGKASESMLDLRTVREFAHQTEAMIWETKS